MPGHVSRRDRRQLSDPLGAHQKLTDELARVQGETETVQQLAQRIAREVDAARAALKIPKP
jgi:alkylation response protein AidB-like acyl-CoA dehydrogenase